MDDSTKLWITTSATIILTIVGFAVKYINDLAMARRKDQLDRVSHQLSDLYGPLYALTRAGTETWDAFFKTYSPSPTAFFVDRDPSSKQVEAFRIWMVSVFQPKNRQMVDVIARHADLLDHDEIPSCLLRLIAHVQAYEAVLKRWEGGDFTEQTSLLNFPGAELDEYVTTTYRRLKSYQLKLLGRGVPR